MTDNGLNLRVLVDLESNKKGVRYLFCNEAPGHAASISIQQISSQLDSIRSTLNEIKRKIEKKGVRYLFSFLPFLRSYLVIHVDKDG